MASKTSSWTGVVALWSKYIFFKETSVYNLISAKKLQPTSGCSKSSRCEASRSEAGHPSNGWVGVSLYKPQRTAPKTTGAPIRTMGRMDFFSSLLNRKQTVIYKPCLPDSYRHREEG